LVVRTASFVVGLLIAGIVLWETFETVVLPRSITRRLRLTGFYFRTSWRLWKLGAGLFGSVSGRERFLAVYGPLSLLGLLTVWATGLIFAFGILHWSAGATVESKTRVAGFFGDLYMSGTTFVTLGLGDLVPANRVGRALAVIEGGLGFGFFGIVITYFPVLYQSFSRREVRLTLLDAWAGSPPAAAEILLRLVGAGDLRSLDAFLKDWEYWCSEVLESHISYPAVAYFRSQHQRQSWVSALMTVLDVAALVEVGIEGVPAWQAHVTFAIARHTAVDLAQVLSVDLDRETDRLPPADLERLRLMLEAEGLRPARSPDADARLATLRRSYEPYVLGLSRRLVMPAPQWWHESSARDNWQTSPKRDGAHL
jgi:ion channel